MTNTYLTGNPLGSTAPRDLYDNSSNFDEGLNSPSPSFLDRFSKRRETWAGMEAAFSDFLQASANVYIGDYVDGTPGPTFTRRNQYIVRGGIAYRPDITTPMPLLLTGTWATDQPKLVAFNSDALLRSDLASSDPTKGAHLVKWKGDFLDEILPTWPEHFGAIGDGVANDTLAVQAWLDSLEPYSTVSGKPGSKYRVLDGFGVQVVGTVLRDTYFVYPTTSATYYHCARITADNCKFIGNTIDTPAGLVRDQTGFGILVAGCDNAEVAGNNIRRVASAAVWLTAATNFKVYANEVFYPLADGIHVSDNCRDGIVFSNKLAGTHDDALAVVGDTPAAAAPQNIVVCNNVVDGTVAGHGCVLIACDTVIAFGNILRGTSGPGFGSYFWQLTGAPTAKDWANNCLIYGNTIVAPGQSALNVNGVAGIFVGAGRGWEIRDNSIGAPASEALTSTSCIRVLACQDVLIEGNRLHDSASYGVWNPDSNVNASLNYTGLVIRGNTFKNIQKQAIRLNSAADMGYIAILRNDFYQCAYDGGTPNLVLVAKTYANLLVICGNNNIDGGKELYFDPATCMNVYASDNSPDVMQTFNPSAVPLSGSWGASTSTGSYYMLGGTVFFRASVSVSTKGSGVGLKLSMPKTLKSGGFGQYSGRENALTGNMLVGFSISGTQLQVTTYTGSGDPISGNGALVELDGWFTSARP